MNNRERLYCAIVKTIYAKYKDGGSFDLNSVLFTYSELEESFNELRFGMSLRKRLFYNYYYGHGSKREKIKYIVNGFAEECSGFYRLAYPGEIDTYLDDLEISEQGWGYLDESKEDVVKFIKKYSLWIKKHKPEKNRVSGLSVNESVWVSAALLTFNTYSHYVRPEINALYFETNEIANLAFSITGEYAKNLYGKATRKRAVKGIGKDSYLSLCQKGKRRITFKRESKQYLPKLDKSIKLYTIEGKKSIKAIINELSIIGMYYFPTEKEYYALKAIGMTERAHICIGDSLVKRNRLSIVDLLMSEMCKEPITYLEFKAKYNSLISTTGVTEEDLMVDDAFEEEFLSRKDILDCGHGRFRYYKNKDLNAATLIQHLNLNRFKNQQISVLLLTRDCSEVMLDAGLKNEYELFDYLRKCGTGFCHDMQFLDDLEIRFGNASVEIQLLELIKKYEPIEKGYLISLYNQRYGSTKEVIQPFLKNLSIYYSGGYYRVSKSDRESDQRSLTSSGISKSTLAQIMDGERIVRRQNPDIQLISNDPGKYYPENTEFGMLCKRLIREFLDYDLVGQVELSDREYDLLLKKRIVPMCERIINSRNPVIRPDIVFCVGIISVAIRKYDSNFWKRVADEVGVKQFTASQQGKIGAIVSQTLIQYGKAYIDETEHVRNILMHAFIVDEYAFDFFEYLFQFYNLDLERSISDTCEEEARYICDAIKNPYSKRQQMLSDYSGLSIYASTDYCATVIAASLKAIDNAFWNTSIAESDIPARLYEKFILWKNNEKGDFRKAKNRKERDAESYKKFFSSPHLIFEYDQDIHFKIVMPRQLLLSDENEHRTIYWRMYTQNSDTRYECDVREGSSGLKTREFSIDISIRSIFEKRVFELYDGSNLVKKYTWEKHNICIFDENFNYISAENISQGDYFGFAPNGIEIRSSAVKDSYDVKGIRYYQFAFNLGDILYVPGEANYYIGEVPQRGFSRDGLLENVIFVDDSDSHLPVYASIPALVVNIEDSKVDGTAIIVNGNKIKASELQPVNIRHGNVLGQKYYYYELSVLNCIKNGLNSIDIDIPGTTRGKRTDFLYLKDFAFSFEDGPYIYKTRGTLKTNYKVERKCIYNSLADEPEYLDFEFSELKGDILSCPIVFDEHRYNLEFHAPVLLCSTDMSGWSFYKPEDYWYSELPKVFYLKYPSKEIRLELTEDNGEVNSFTYQRRNDGIIECDLTKLRSYLGPSHTKKMVHSIVLRDRDITCEFIRVVNRSVFVGVELIADTDNGLILGCFDVIGKGVYYADVRFKNEKICEKLPLNSEHQIQFEAQIQTGLYEVVLYEGEEDEDSFDEIVYTLVDRKERNLRNPEDISGERVELKSFTYVRDSKQIRNLSISDKRQNYIRIDSKIRENVYEGLLIVAFHNVEIIDAKKVRIKIPDIRHVNAMLIYFHDEQDDVDNFLYDSKRECVATPEYSEQYGKSEKYRRFGPVLWTDEDESYIWNVEFITANRPLEQKAIEWMKTKHFKPYKKTIWK